MGRALRAGGLACPAAALEPVRNERLDPLSPLSVHANHAEDQGIAEYNLYREGNWIGTVAYDNLSIYLDQEADPETIEKANEEGVPILMWPESAFDFAGQVCAAGVITPTR